MFFQHPLGVCMRRNYRSCWTTAPPSCWCQRWFPLRSASITTARLIQTCTVTRRTVKKQPKKTVNERFSDEIVDRRLWKVLLFFLRATRVLHWHTLLSGVNYTLPVYCSLCSFDFVQPCTEQCCAVVPSQGKIRILYFKVINDVFDCLHQRWKPDQNHSWSLQQILKIQLRW